MHVTSSSRMELNLDFRYHLCTSPLYLPVTCGWSSLQICELCWVTWKWHMIFPGNAFIKPRRFFCNVKHTCLYHRPLSQNRCMHTVPQHQRLLPSTKTLAFQHWELDGLDFTGLTCTRKHSFRIWNMNTLSAMLLVLFFSFFTIGCKL